MRWFAIPNDDDGFEKEKVISRRSSVLSSTAVSKRKEVLSPSKVWTAFHIVGTGLASATQLRSDSPEIPTPHKTTIKVETGFSHSCHCNVRM